MHPSNLYPVLPSAFLNTVVSSVVLGLVVTIIGLLLCICKLSADARRVRSWQRLRDDIEFGSNASLAETTAASPADQKCPPGDLRTASDVRAALAALEEQRRLHEEWARERRASEARIAAVEAELEAERAKNLQRPPQLSRSNEIPSSAGGGVKNGDERERTSSDSPSSDNPDVASLAAINLFQGSEEGGEVSQLERLEEAQELLGLLIEERMLLQEAREDFFEAQGDGEDESEAYDPLSMELPSTAVYRTYSGEQLQRRPGSRGSGSSPSRASTPVPAPAADPVGDDNDERSHALLDELVQRTERVHALQSALVRHLVTPDRVQGRPRISTPSPSMNDLDMDGETDGELPYEPLATPRADLATAPG